MMEKIYISGCGGMLGRAFHDEFRADYALKCSDIDVNEDWLSFCDTRNLLEYQNDVEAFSPDYIFHLGAYTDLEYCELHQKDTYITNTLTVENACYIANSLNIPLLYISTAGIFDGKQDSYNDWDQPNPLCVYAKTKYYGECFVKEHVREHLICRAGWMMGGGQDKDKKFVNKIMLQIKQGKKELFVVGDKQGTPTYTVDFAKNVKLLLGKKYWGLYNMVCSGETSRFEVAQEILKILGLTKTIKLTMVDSGHFNDAYFAPRPDSERLVNTKLELRDSNIMRDWKIALREYLEKDYM